MGIHKPYSDTIVLLPSAPLTSGGSLDLANGQVGAFATGKRSARGISAISSVTNLDPNQKIFLQIGTGINGNRGSLTNRPMATVEFLPSDVRKLAFTPAQEGTVSAVVIGYDGHDVNKNMSLKAGQTAEVTIELSGDIIAFYGKKNGKYLQTFTLNTDHPSDCEEVDVCEAVNMKPHIEALVEQIKNELFVEGIKLGDLLNVYGVYSGASVSGTSTKNFYSLSIVDAGDDNALGLVQAIVGGAKVVRVERNGLTSVYQVVASALPTAYTLYKPSVLVDCTNCPSDYTEVEGGFLYTISVEDDAVDVKNTLVTSPIDTVSLTTSTTIIGEAGNSYVGVATTTSGSGVGATVTVVRNGAGAVSSVAIVAAGTGYAIGDTLTIAGTLVGGTAPAANITLTITAITAVVSVAKVGQEYGVGKYSLLLSDKMSDVQLAALIAKQPTAKIAFEGEYADVCAYTGAATTTAWVEGEECDLTEQEYYIDLYNDDCEHGRLAELQAAYPSLTISIDSDFMDDEAPEGTCKGRYKTSVISNMVCEGCYKDAFITEAPAPFEFEEWQKVPAVASDAPFEKVGIYFEPKEFVICPDKAIADQLQTIISPMEIQVSGGELVGTKIGYSYNKNKFPVTRKGRAFRGTGYGIDFMCSEGETKQRMLGITQGNGYVESYLKDNVTKLTPCEQYDTISIEVKASEFSNGFSNVKDTYVRYNFVIPQGTLGLYKSFFNAVAASSPKAGSL